nr:glycerophosphotransferase [Caulobacter sp. NIBR2454]
MKQIESGASGRSGASRRKRQVAFLYIAQQHQILHSITIAIELARGWPDIEVHALAVTSGHIDYLRTTIAALGGAPIKLKLLGPAALRNLRRRGASTPPKAVMLAANLRVLARYDAIVTPERTTAMVRRLGLIRPALIYTQHGAGDRGGPFEPRLKVFDLVMAAGPKQYARMVDCGLVEAEHCAMVGYPKFDLVDGLAIGQQRLFENDRPSVLYNPHFDPTLSSWPGWGMQVLEQFAAQDRYNLIFAPHLRLFDGANLQDRARLAKFKDHPNIRIDLGGPATIDMTYTTAADAYLGDVSSQIYEFVRKPRPTAFLNAHGVAWRDDPNYRHWAFGPVAERVEDLMPTIDRAFAEKARYIPEQQAGFSETFDLRPETSSLRAARAVANCLEKAQVRPS